MSNMSERFSDYLAFSGGAIRPLYLGHVATSTGVHASTNTTNKYIKGVSDHYARDCRAGWFIEDANWYVASNVAPSDGTEAVLGSSAATIERWVEYPAGVYTRVTYSGANVGTIAAGATLRSDAIDLTIPAGARFWLWYLYQNPDGISFRVVAPSPDNRCVFAPGTSTLTPGETITQSGNWYPPVAIIGMTRLPSLSFCGDSRVVGIGDTADDSLNTGHFARALGDAYAYANLGARSDRVNWAKVNYTRRAQIAAYGSHIFCEYGTNDIASGISSASTLSSLQAFYDLDGIRGKPLYQATVEPQGVTSTDGYVTEANQTVDATTSVRTTFNNALRNGVAKVHGIIDIAAAFESTATAGKWQVVNGLALTDDGTHANKRGYLRQKSLVIYPRVE